MTCKTIKNLIVRYHCGDSLKEEETNMMERHLPECEDCRKYFSIITTIAHSQEPDPVDLTSVEKNLNGAFFVPDKNNRRINAGWQIYLFIRRCFSFRIPLYQPVLAVILLLFILSQFNIDFKKRNDSVMQHADSLMDSAVPMRYRYVIDNIDIIKEQKIGETVNEDSSLLKFSYSVF